MCRLFETIRVTDGVPQHVLWHEARMNRARREIWNTAESLVLEPLLTVPREFSAGVVRCNVRYGPGIESVVFSVFEKKPVRSLKLVTCNSIDYHLKYSDRKMLESLLELRGGCDDIIIVKEGLVTDTSMSNIIFLDGGTWITPAKPLLRGTCRERLIAGGSLKERDIRAEDVSGFAGWKIINAMRDPGEEMILPVSRIIQ
jgi:4-amino-4-deoxychorismate lyase